MKTRIALAACLSLVAFPAQSQDAPKPMGILAPAPREDLVKVVLDTDKGRIVLALDKGRAPVTKIACVPTVLTKA